MNARLPTDRAARRILVVEDYGQLRELMKTLLQEVGGHEVLTAADSASAAALVTQQHFDLILLDIGIPGALNGWDIARMARARAICPILFITGRDPAVAAASREILPSDGFLLKPFRMDTLLKEAERLLDQAQPASGEPARLRNGATSARRPFA